MAKTPKPAKKPPASKRTPTKRGSSTVEHSPDKGEAGCSTQPPATTLGRPSGYKPEFAKIAESMAKLGATDIEVADAIDIDVRTLYRWKGQFEDFCQALKSGKEVADERVERSLFARANGYEHDEVDIRVVDHRIIQTPIRKFYPPDTTAAIFWLKNRRPDLWRDKTDVNHSGTIGIRAAQEMTDDELAAIAAGSGAGAAGPSQGENEPTRVH